MSLVVWLPLTKDLRQQGLANTSSLSLASGNSLTNGGKIGGQCLALTKLQTILGNSSCMSNKKQISYAYWIKVNTAWSTNWLDGIRWTSSNGTTNSVTRQEFYTNCTKVGTWFPSSSTNSISGKDFTPEVWTHLAATFDYSTGDVNFYINGVLQGHVTTLDTTYYCRGDFYIGDNGVDVSMNDVRIYDHALSQMEIKEIAKGLVLHYPLADTYIEATTNLITTEDCLSSTCYNGATSKYSYGTSTDMYKTVTTYDGRKGTKVYMGTNGNNCYPYVYINGMYTSNGTNSPEYKTLSFDYYTTVSTSICPYKLGSGTGTATYIVNANGIERTGTGTNSVVVPIVPNTWNHVEITFHGTTDADAQWGYIQNQPAHVSNTNNFWFFANMQLETKDHATGYAGVGGTRNSNIIYDTSGFCNNGTISGALTISNDTPKYKASTYMPKAALITHPRSVFGGTDQEWTCAMWVKLDTANQSQQAMNNFNYSNNIVHAANGTPLLYLNAGANDYYMYGSQAVSAGVWTHVVFVFKNSDGTRNIYINGVLKNNYGPNRTSTPSGIQDVVTVGTNLAGYISDYRVYATALSADDVKSLYQNCATIDPDGTIRGQIRD